ncbi:hypothetical protein [Streptomyces sp. NPDC101165]|uniref:hypothetical protein n=1 Tax=Streptomyces sp. NPDC101165 TaxID=3366119 RepID=UPI003800CD78
MPMKRRLDAVNYKTGEFVEAKADGAHDDKQNASTRALMKDPRFKNFRMRYVFGGEQEDDTKSLMNKFRQEFGRDNRGRRRMTTYEHRSLGIPQYERTKYSRLDTNLAPPGRYSKGPHPPRAAGAGAVPHPVRVGMRVIFDSRERWSGTIYILDNVRRTMDRWGQTGECLDGRYFYVWDGLIVRQRGIPGMVDVVDDLVRSDGYRSVFRDVGPEDMDDWPFRPEATWMGVRSRAGAPLAWCDCAAHWRSCA